MHPARPARPPLTPELLESLLPPAPPPALIQVSPGATLVLKLTLLVGRPGDKNGG